MRIRSHDLADRALIIAEIGNNHEGDYALAREMVCAAAESGVDAVKFQTFIPELFIAPSQPERLQRLRGFALSIEQFAALAALAHEQGLIFISTPLDLDSAAALESLVDAYKVASGDNTFYPLLRRIADTGLPLILSGGLATIDELAHAAGLVRSIWRRAEADPGLAILHCVSAYPTPPEQANLAAIRTIAESLPALPGYSDHTLGIEAAVLSIAFGARVIEKHFTLDHHQSDFRDHQLSATPDEMRTLVSRAREAERMIGGGAKRPQTCEREGLTAFRRSIVARRDLPAGAILTMEDLSWVRPGGGLAPGEEHRILGRRLTRSAPAGAPLTLEMMSCGTATFAATG